MFSDISFSAIGGNFAIHESVIQIDNHPLEEKKIHMTNLISHLGSVLCLTKQLTVFHSDNQAAMFMARQYTSAVTQEL